MIRKVVFCLGALISSISADASQAATVKVGVVLPYSGSVAETAQMMSRGMKLYYDLHKGELGSNDIQLVERDSKEGSGATAQTLTRELIVRDKVDILSGYLYSPDAISSAPIATQGKKPMLLGLATSSFVTNLSPYVVRLSSSSWQMPLPMGEYAYNKVGCRTVVTGFPDFPPGKDATLAFKTGFEALGGKVIDETAMGGLVQVPDYTPFLQRLKNQKPDCAFIFTPSGSFNIAFARSARELKIAESGIKILGTVDLTPDSNLQAMGPAAAGWISSGHYTADLQTPENKKFVEAFTKAYGPDSRPDFLAVQGYDMMAAIFHIVKTLDGKIDGAKAVEVLRDWKYESPRGPIAIDPATRDIVQNIYMMEVANNDGRMSMKVFETLPAVKDPCKELKVGRCAAGAPKL